MGIPTAVTRNPAPVTVVLGPARRPSSTGKMRFPAPKNSPNVMSPMRRAVYLGVDRRSDMGNILPGWWRLLWQGRFRGHLRRWEREFIAGLSFCGQF